VGPRPEVPEYKTFYTGPLEAILSVRPGLTDPASIIYRDEEKVLSQSLDPQALYKEKILPEKLNISLRFLRDGMSLKKDLKVILDTFKVVWGGTRALGPGRNV
jgi:lipopolysaccharide/colanic/teichoic acid biosynthesis glycosyltransferase